MNQTEAKDNFIDILNNLISDIDKVDKQTPYSPAEPNWWLQMIAFQSQARELRKSLQNPQPSLPNT